jgi:hypothetical protein
VLPVDGHTAAHTHALTLKQMRSLNVPTWVDQERKMKEICNMNDDGTVKEYKSGQSAQHIQFYCCTTDSGSDEKRVHYS